MEELRFASFRGCFVMTTTETARLLLTLGGASMKRTVCLATLPLNPGKRAALREVLGLYANAKRSFITALRSPSMWHHLDNKRGFRDWAKAQGLYPPQTPVHLVDQAAFEATEICARYIESVLARAQVKARIRRRFTDEAERHYAYACLARYGALGAIMCGATPDLSAGGLCKDRRAAVTRYLHRVLRKALPEEEWPTVRGARSMSLDDTLYSTFAKERPGKQPERRQYVSVVGPRLRERIVIPLAGVSRISANIRVVLDEGEERAFIHVAYEAKPLPGGACGDDRAIDWGISEVCTDDAGKKHGGDYGRVLEKATDQRNATGKARGKLPRLQGAALTPSAPRGSPSTTSDQRSSAVDVPVPKRRYAQSREPPSRRSSTARATAPARKGRSGNYPPNGPDAWF
jgi:putative transposase